MSKQDNTNNTTHGNVAIADAPDRVTITVTGAAFENLKAAAATFSAWDGETNTPADIVRRFLLPDFCDVCERAPGEAGNVAAIIADFFDGDAEGERLKAMMGKAGFSTEMI